MSRSHVHFDKYIVLVLDLDKLITSDSDTSIEKQTVDKK